TLPAVIGQGSRHNTLVSMAGSMRRVGASQDVILAALLELNKTAQPPMTEAEVGQVARGIAKYEPRSATTEFPLTEMGNAERFCADYGDILRYCATQKQWLIWNGRRWKPDATQLAKSLAMKMVRKLYADASDLPDKTDRAALLKHANSSQTDA